MSTLGFSQFAEQNPGKLALAAPDGRHWSRGELLAKCHQIAHSLRFLGIRDGDSVVALLPNSAELIALKFALSQIGGVLVPLRYSLCAAEVAHTLKCSGAGAFIAHEKYHAVARQAADMANQNNCVNLALGNIEDFLSFNSLIEIYPETTPENCRPEYHEAHLIALFDIHPESNNVHFCGSELYNPRVMFWATQCLHSGHALVLAQQWNALAMLHAISQYRVTTSYMFKSQFEKLLLLPIGVREQYDVSSIRHVVTDAPSGDPDIIRAMNLWWGDAIYEFYVHHFDYDKVGVQTSYPALEMEILGKGFRTRETQNFSESADTQSQKLSMKNH
ncbi:MAG: AMP-binding protein [Halioglobus sp.]